MKKTVLTAAAILVLAASQYTNGATAQAAPTDPGPAVDSTSRPLPSGTYTIDVRTGRVISHTDVLPPGKYSIDVETGEWKPIDEAADPPQFGTNIVEIPRTRCLSEGGHFKVVPAIPFVPRCFSNPGTIGTNIPHTEWFETGTWTGGVSWTCCNDGKVRLSPILGPGSIGTLVGGDATVIAVGIR